MQKIRVLTGMKIFPEADYEIDNTVELGSIVEIPLRKSRKLAVVINYIDVSKFKLKKAQKTNFILPEYYLKFINQTSMITLHNMQKSLETTIKMFSNRWKKAQFNFGNYQTPNFNQEQQNALDIIRNSKKKIFLLWGVTGSGKTEVFFDIINETIKNSQQVLLILPEIAIGESITDRFFNAFGFYPVIWNSKSKNKTNFNNITNGNVSVVIGSRCSIFLPFKNLGLIVVDEEHDNSYKQTTSPIYNCRDLAVLHGKTQNIKVILASATPSLESFFNTQRKQYELIRLTYRHNERPLPTIKFSISENNEICSAYTLQRVAEELANNKQIVFFLNRRGFAQIVNCKNCFSRLQCKKCQNMLTFHYSKKILLCHKCGANYNSDTCVLCKTFGSLVPYGIGVEKIQKYLLEKFNNYNIKIISSDTCDSIEEIKNFISDMKNKMIDIAIGTQILAKGHNFPEISLVVILGLNGMAFNFKATEQTFQTLVQVSGRAGRGDTNAEVIVQIDRNFDSLIMQYLKNHDYEKFLHYEIEERRKWNLMPFVKIIAVKYFNKSESICIDELKKCKQTLNSKIFLQISEPIFIKFSNNTYYYQLFLRISRENFIEYNDALRGSFDNKFIIDVDPISFDF